MTGQLKGDALFSFAMEQHLDTVYRVAVHNTPIRADAEDVTQEVFEALLRSGKAFQDGEHVKAWLIRVTLNRCKNLHRAAKRAPVPLDAGLPAPAASDQSAPVPLSPTSLLMKVKIWS